MHIQQSISEMCMLIVYLIDYFFFVLWKRFVIKKIKKIDGKDAKTRAVSSYRVRVISTAVVTRPRRFYNAL